MVVLGWCSVGVVERSSLDVVTGEVWNDEVEADEVSSVSESVIECTKTNSNLSNESKQKVEIGKNNKTLPFQSIHPM